MSDITEPVANLGPAVAVMARSPCGARAPKSRLAGVLPDEADRRRLYAGFLQDVVSACAAIDGATLRVAYTADGGTAGFDEFGVAPGQLLPQCGDSLGARERGVFEDLFGLGFSPVVLVGSDLPTLPMSRIDDAIGRLLAGHDRVVLGPADDGGYYLMGLSRNPVTAAIPDLFTTIRWSSEWTRDDTVAAAERCGLRVELLDAWYDVDDGAGLARLQREVATEQGSSRAPATKRVLDALAGGLWTGPGTGLKTRGYE